MPEVLVWYLAHAVSSGAVACQSRDYRVHAWAGVPKQVAKNNSKGKEREREREREREMKIET